MSLVVTILQFLFALLAYITSLKGIFTILLGLAAFLLLPVVPRITGEFKRLAHLPLWIATGMLGRAAIVVSEHGDLLLKRMSFDGLGVETITIDGDKKEFEDPDNALHYWMGIPFALADEKHGVLFDPRHSALGMRKRDADERHLDSAKATSREWSDFNIHEWKLGAYRMPRVHELVDLGAVRRLVDGGERAEYPDRTQSLYQHSRKPLMSGTSATRFIMIVVALIGPFAALWLIATQGPSSAGGGGGSTVSFGTLLALLAAPLADDDIDPWQLVILFIGVAAPLAAFAALAVFVHPIFAVLAAVTFFIGFAIVPMLTVLVRPSARLSSGMAGFLFKLGFSSFDTPVFEWTPKKYRLREASELDVDNEVDWYGLAGTTIGFTYSPSPDVWGAAHLTDDDLESMQQGDAIVADGGTVETNIPDGYVGVPEMRRAGSYAGYIPRDPDDDAYYLHTGIARSRFTDVANGEKSLNRLLWAKDEYGEDDGLDDKTVVYAMLACGIVSFLMGVFIFFL